MRSLLSASNPAAEVDDVTLLRFLAADGFDVDLGHARLVETIAWRVERRVGSILGCPPL